MNTTEVLESIEDFFYTPYGLGAVAGAAIILTSLVWCLGCCIYCCCTKCRKMRGVAEANGEIEYLSVVHSSNTLESSLKAPHNEHGTGTSGYQSHIGDYSLDSLRATEVTTSMDSILNK